MSFALIILEPGYFVSPAPILKGYKDDLLASAWYMKFRFVVFFSVRLARA